MKILMITSMFPTPFESHNGISIYQTVNLLREQYGSHVRVIYPVPTLLPGICYIFNSSSCHQNFPGSWEFDGFKINYPRYPKTPLPLASPLQLFLFRKFLTDQIVKSFDQFRPDLIWVQPSVPHACLAENLRQQFNIPYVIVVHGWDLNVSARQPRQRKMLKGLYGQAERVIVISERIRREVQAINPDSRTVLIPNGTIMSEVEDDQIGDGTRTATFSVISVSNLIKTKGITYNLQALSELQARGVAVSYTIVGEGPERSYLEKLVQELRLGEAVTFTGGIERPAMLELLREADLFSLPSYAEGLGLVYLEAMALGLPVIGVRGQGISDVIDHGTNGYLVDPQTSGQIGSIIEQLSQDPEARRKIGLRARQTIAGGYTWESIVPQYHQVFSEIVDRSQVK